MQRVTLVPLQGQAGSRRGKRGFVRAVFAELRTQTPEGVSYALFRDGLDFVHLFVNSEADDSTILTELPAFKVFSKRRERALRGAAGSDSAGPQHDRILWPRVGDGAGLSDGHGQGASSCFHGGADEAAGTLSASFERGEMRLSPVELPKIMPIARQFASQFHGNVECVIDIAPHAAAFVLFCDGAVS